jgi:hypothetical protein
MCVVRSPLCPFCVSLVLLTRSLACLSPVHVHVCGTRQSEEEEDYHVRVRSRVALAVGQVQGPLPI